MLKKILIADDDMGILEVMKIILEEAGFEVLTISNSNIIEKKIEEESPDLVYLDIAMSGQDGGEITKNLKKNVKTKSIPVIIVSANHKTERIAKECGADGFLLKPFEMSELINLTKEYTNG